LSKAHKFRVYPSKEQETQFAKTFGCARFKYSRMPAGKLGHYGKPKKISCASAQLKAEFPWLKDVDSLAFATAQLHLQAAFSNFSTTRRQAFPSKKAGPKGAESLLPILQTETSLGVWLFETAESRQSKNQAAQGTAQRLLPKICCGAQSAVLQELCSYCV
jgi:transposase